MGIMYLFRQNGGANYTYTMAACQEREWIMNPDSMIRVTEYLHALKIYIAASNRLTQRDIEHVVMVAKAMDARRRNHENQINNAGSGNCSRSGGSSGEEYV